MTTTPLAAALAVLALAVVALAAPVAAQPATGAPAEPAAGEALAALVERSAGVTLPTRSAAEVEAAAETYRQIVAAVEALDPDTLSFDQRIDLELLERHATTRLFEIEDVRLHELVPVNYLALYQTDALTLRPCGAGGEAVRGAIAELEALPEILDNARENLLASTEGGGTGPARVWTENALATIPHAVDLLAEEIPHLCLTDRGLAGELEAAAGPALEAVRGYERWLRETLLPLSRRTPAWTPEQIDHYQLVHEGLEGYDVDRMIEIAAAEEARLTDEMEALADRIHPSGDLATVWGLMKEEAPPWDEVQPMAEDYVERAARWLETDGAHLVDIPEVLDYGVVLTSPMARRLLSFGGASYGPTIGGRISGYYVLTPPPAGLTEEERRSRLRSYNPYWTHVISYHEWLGHNVQRAVAEAHRGSSGSPMRSLFRSSYLSQAWSFYLEALLEVEGYYETLPHMERLKTAMARRQMRMWRVQRILTKLRMARGEMTFDQAVQAYVDKIGMEPGNAFVEVQRDSQNPSPPGREIIGELAIFELREEYRRRMGDHYDAKAFHEALLRWGELPLDIVSRLIFRD